MKSVKKRAALYIRVSTLDQANEGYSLEAQEAALKKWCVDHRYEIHDLYADRGISGKTMDHRPEMVRLMRDAKANKFDVVLFWALSRFTRSVSDLYRSMAFFKEHGVDMISYTESFDTSTPMGRAMMGIVGVFAQLERELTSERVISAATIRAAQGKPTCSSVLGYDLLEGELIVNDQEAEQVRFYFESYLTRKSLSEVAELARQRGYKGKRGKSPTAQSIRMTLTRPVYCGLNSFRGATFKGSHEPIVTVDTFNSVQRLLRRQGKLSGRHANALPKYIPK